MNENEILIGVCGAHMSGLALNWQLTDLEATFVKKCKTKKGYRLFLLENKTPIRPGMIYDSNVNSQLELEVWSMKVENFGKFMKQIASPLGIGTVFLEDESSVYGFLCEVDYVKNSKEIASLGSWRNFLCQQQQ